MKKLWGWLRTAFNPKAPNRYCPSCVETGEECSDCFNLWQIGA